ncbi:MAG: hypothetical protein HON32_04510 [Francisellaceae bacterium]|jgi:glycerophosphoryl diester phosphodiesterase|nr:hypothetical protein [Francisellaceae bacterium]MBT6539835.1 hypothetical protein [Francisellaceae bacterium]
MLSNNFDCCSILQPQPNFKLIGHRGFSGLRPENTMASFKHAQEIGLNWIELDARLTKCDNWVIFHDDTLERFTGSQDSIEDSTLSDLIKLDFGSWFDTKYKNEKIVMLREILSFAAQNNIFINLEIKPSNKIKTSRYAQKLMRFLANTIANNQPYPLVSSFDTALLVELRKLSENLRLGYLIEEFDNEVWTNINKYHFSTLNSDTDTTEHEHIQKAKRMNIPSLVYVVNDFERAKELFNYGACGIFTDRADLIIEGLKSQSPES